MHVLNLETRSGRRGRFGSLLLVLSVTFIVGPLLSDEAQGVSGLSILYSVVMLVGIYSVSQNKKVLMGGLALALPALLFEWLSNFVVTTGFVVANMVLAGVFITYVTGVILYEVLDEDRVTMDTIAGGVTIYLLFGVGWVTTYAAVEHLQPGAFLVQGQTLASLHGETQVRYSELSYFSFVTLTTLGYGDIVPTTPAARTAATAQAVVGQLYVAVFVARLVARIGHGGSVPDGQSFAACSPVREPDCLIDNIPHRATTFETSRPNLIRW